MITAKKKVLILVVEDEKILVNTLEEKLLAEGFEVLKAYNGIDGFTLALSEHPNLILLDLLMPKMDGMSMLKELRKDDWGKNVPVIILTNLTAGDEERNRDITKLEPSYYFMKTEKSLEEIIEKIKEILNIKN
ncbi:MAG: response regulator [Candidatus Paceibacterota bacterium]|jgi:DNA-binding response OmpR family regulator